MTHSPALVEAARSIHGQISNAYCSQDDDCPNCHVIALALQSQIEAAVAEALKSKPRDPDRNPYDCGTPRKQRL